MGSSIQDEVIQIVGVDMRRISFEPVHEGVNLLVDGEVVPRVYEVTKGSGDFDKCDPFKGFDAEVTFEWVTGKGFVVTLSR